MRTAAALDSETLQKENVDLRNKVVYLEEQLAWFKRQIFGKKSERIISELNTEQMQFEGFEKEEILDEKTQTVPAPCS